MLGLGKLRFFNSNREKRNWESLLSSTFSQILPNYIKDSSKITTQYSVELKFRERCTLDDIYWDTHFGVVLKYNDQAVACIGFDLDPDPFKSLFVPKIVTVRQLQGVKGKQDLMKGIRWERLLLRLTLLISKTLHYKRLEVQRGENNRWNRYGDRLETFKLRYDVTAFREGLFLDQKRDVYSINLVS